MSRAVEWLAAATEQHRAGNLAEARRLYEELLHTEPEHDVALFRLGLVDLQEGRHEAAAALILKAAERSPGEVRYHLGLAQALQSLERWLDAAAALRRALELEPGSFDARLDLGVALQRGGERSAAASAYRAALRLQPEDPRALGNLGALLRELGELDEAARLLEQAARRAPDAASHAINLAILRCERREFSAAEQILRGVLAREPENADAAFNLGNALRGLGRPHEAIEHYRCAAASRPTHAEALNNLGNAYKETGEFSAAAAAFAAALAARPNYLAAINNAGCLLRTLGRLDEAEDTLRRGLALDSRQAALHDNLANVLKDAGELDEAIAHYRLALDLEPGNAATHSNLAYALSFRCAEPEPILEECLRWGARFAAPIVAPPAPAAPDLSPERRLRIGYVSGDFREHCQSLFTRPLLEHHDRRGVEVFCYSSVERRDAWTQRLERCADAWREVRSLDDAALAERVRDDRIDILVDLNMHMANGRPLLFARKPAPVQIAWLAYPGTTGIAAMDYRLSDPRLDPDTFDRHYSERTLRLADTFWCYEPQIDDLEVNELPAIEKGHLTFGCLNNPCKLTERTLDLWSGVLRAIPDAELRLLAPPGRHRGRLTARFGARGIAEARLRFVEFRPRAAYLELYHEIDIGLDTLPYNGHTTSLDALWMGVPIVTRIGDTCVGRAGLSQLFHLDLLDLVADSDAAFVAIAAALAADLERLRTLRSSLRRRMQRSPLMDAARFARSIEHAYRSAWRAHCGSARD
jgi:protein O-GlcNAc transferase